LGGGDREAGPGGWPAGDLPAAVAETHVSALFFYRDRVLKVRKPVHYGFVDFRGLEARRLDCEREVELNRRLSPDVYLGTATVSLGGEAVEHAVVMRRLPPERNLEHLVTSGRPVEREVRQVAATLAAFHERAARSPAIDASATGDALRQRWLGVAADLAPFVGPVVDPDRYHELGRLASRYLEGRSPLLEERVAAGAVVDGHGDLQAADVFCLDDGPRILDCLEFDSGLRHGDRLADAAFLAADLERLGAAGPAAQFLDEYRRRAGDDPPRSLLDFYVASRAHVRVLVECLKARAAPRPGGDAGRLLDVAGAHLRRGTVRLVTVGGPPGSGKSTLAGWLGARLGATVLRTDEIREGLDLPRGDPRRYTPARRGRVYDRMCRLARDELVRGRSVVLDGTWSSRAWRRAAARTAAEAVADLHEVRCDCPPALRAARIAGRSAGAAGSSEVTPAAAELVAAATDPWPTAIAVDCAGTVEAAGRSVLAALPPAPW
jgi:aminoglycoside phosphotransferase family enzyme/predicted kinase